MSVQLQNDSYVAVEAGIKDSFKKVMNKAKGMLQDLHAKTWQFYSPDKMREQAKVLDENVRTLKSLPKDVYARHKNSHDVNLKANELLLVFNEDGVKKSEAAYKLSKEYKSLKGDRSDKAKKKRASIRNDILNLKKASIADGKKVRAKIGQLRKDYIKAIKKDRDTYAKSLKKNKPISKAASVEVTAVSRLWIQSPAYFDRRIKKIKKQMTRVRQIAKEKPEAKAVMESLKVSLGHVDKMRRAAGMYKKLIDEKKGLKGDYSDKASDRREKIGKNMTSLQKWFDKERTKFKSTLKGSKSDIKTALKKKKEPATDNIGG